MSRRYRQLWKVQISFHDVQIGVAETARVDAKPHLVGPGMRRVEVQQRQRLAVNQSGAYETLRTHSINLGTLARKVNQAQCKAAHDESKHRGTENTEGHRGRYF